MRFKNHTSVSAYPRRGQSLMEILVGMTIGVFLIMAGIGLIVPALKTNTQVTNVQRGAVLAKELLDNVRVWSEGDWHNVFRLPTGTANPYYMNVLQSPFTVATGTESVASNPVTSGLVGWWKFDEGGGTNALDSSGQSATGTWQGTLGSQWTAGKVGPYAGSFNGTDNYVSLPSTNMIGTGNSSFTVSLWVKPQSLSGAQYFFPIRLKQDTQFFWCFYYNNGTPISFGVFRGNVYTQWGTPIDYNSMVNKWNYISIVYNGGDKNLASSYQQYINGAALSPGSVSLGAAGGVCNDNAIGSDANDSCVSNMGLLNGQIDDIRIYKRALSATEISQLYTSPAFTRYFYVSDVYRNGSGAIASSGTYYDPSTKQITAGYSWPGGSTNTMSMYLSRNRDNIYDQTDWSGGLGTTTPVTIVGNQFVTSSNIDYTTTTGSIYVILPQL